VKDCIFCCMPLAVCTRHCDDESSEEQAPCTDQCTKEHCNKNCALCLEAGGRLPCEQLNPTNRPDKNYKSCPDKAFKGISEPLGWWGGKSEMKHKRLKYRGTRNWIKTKSHTKSPQVFCPGLGCESSYFIGLGKAAHFCGGPKALSIVPRGRNKKPATVLTKFFAGAIVSGPDKKSAPWRIHGDGGQTGAVS